MIVFIGDGFPDFWFRSRFPSMQTFLPYASFELSAKVLDRQRLGKQRVEVLQILQALNGERQAFHNHPATLMWEPYIEALVEYGVTVCREWIRRGYRDTCLRRIMRYSCGNRIVLPDWFGGPIHSSHRSAMLYKNFERYRRFGWSESPAVPDKKGSLPYYWPTKELTNG